jgi:outer membrane lipoprotein-sorting protein
LATRDGIGKHEATRTSPNMRQRLITIFSFVLFIAIPLVASAKEEVASEGIDAIESAYRTIDDLTAAFTQTTEVALVGRTVTRSGVFQFKKGGKLRIEYTGKDPKNYISDGTTLWTYVPGDEGSLQTFQVSDRTVPKEALSFLSGFGKLTKEFSVVPSKAFKDAAAGTTALHLVPKSKNAQYESLEALFGADHMLAELIVRNESGNVSHYRFSGIKTNQKIPDNRFTLSSGKATPDTLPE